MAEDIRWAFYGYVTPAGNRDVWDWFCGLEPEAKDEIIDALAFLRVLPRSRWCMPRFRDLGESLSEIRLRGSAQNKPLRIYGFFWPQGRHQYTFLRGSDEKKHQDHDIAEARKRLKRVTKAEAGIHEFDFESGV